MRYSLCRATWAFGIHHTSPPGWSPQLAQGVIALHGDVFDPCEQALLWTEAEVGSRSELLPITAWLAE
jgi:hypothetical protein